MSAKFTLFVGSFAGWAADKEKALNDDLKAANEKLETLNKHLKNLTIASYVMIGVEAAGAVAIGAAFFCGPVGPFVAVCALQFVGHSLEC